MRAAVITEPGGPEVFRIQEIPDPIPGPEDVLVEVKATALNRADLLQRRGRYPAPLGIRGDVPGLEMAGVVLSVGDLVEGFSEGDRVFGLLGGGGYAEKVITNYSMLAHIPDNLDFNNAAAVPEVFMTAYDALFNHCELRMGESALIHAAGSGVGTAAIQLAKSVGAVTFGTAGSQEKIDKAKELGLDLGVNYNTQQFPEVIKDATNSRGVDVILDVIGAPYWVDNISSLTTKGRMVIVGTMGGATQEVNLGALMQKRLTIKGTVLRSRSMPEKMTLNQQFVKHVLPLLGHGNIKPVVDRIFSIEEVADAHTYMETNANFGKIILSF
tara:strand:- start:2449 stop:3429 length:981 start_codon:yes stop_codon:yes gene_type:complete